MVLVVRWRGGGGVEVRGAAGNTEYNVKTGRARKKGNPVHKMATETKAEELARFRPPPHSKDSISQSCIHKRRGEPPPRSRPGSSLVNHKIKK